MVGGNAWWEGMHAAHSATACTYPALLNARRSLYRHLVHMEQAVGCWRSVGDGPEGTLLHVGWRRDHLEAVHLVCNTAQLDPLPR